MFDKAFNEWHILAISQAIRLYREPNNIDCPLFMGMDTHDLSVPSILDKLSDRRANQPGAPELRFRRPMPGLLIRVRDQPKDLSLPLVEQADTKCPYRGNGLPTSQALQCFSCGMDWHDRANPVQRGDPIDDSPTNTQPLVAPVDVLDVPSR